MSFEEQENRNSQLKKSLAVLESRKAGKKFNQTELILLKNVEKYMIGAAADLPGTYLQALTNLRKIYTLNNLNYNEIGQIQQAIQKMMRVDYQRPQPLNSIQASTLSQRYFNHLKKGEK